MESFERIMDQLSQRWRHTPNDLVNHIEPQLYTLRSMKPMLAHKLAFMLSCSSDLEAIKRTLWHISFQSPGQMSQASHSAVTHASDIVDIAAHRDRERIAGLMIDRFLSHPDHVEGLRDLRNVFRFLAPKEKEVLFANLHRIDAGHAKGLKVMKEMKHDDRLRILNDLDGFKARRRSRG